MCSAGVVGGTGEVTLSGPLWGRCRNLRPTELAHTSPQSSHYWSKLSLQVRFAPSLKCRDISLQTICQPQIRHLKVQQVFEQPRIEGKVQNQKTNDQESNLGTAPGTELQWIYKIRS